jgi:hypothetical protein
VKDEVVAAAEAGLAAATELPDDPGATGKAEMLAALKVYDVAETRLDDAMDAYLAATVKGKRT